MGEQPQDDRSVGFVDLEKAISPETASRIKGVMDKKKISEKDLAQLSGLTSEQVEDYFKSSERTTNGTFQAICKALGITTNIG